MDKRRGPRKLTFVAVAVLAIVLAASGSAVAAGVGGHGGGGHPGGMVGHAFDGHHFEGHFDGHHFDRGHFHGRFGFVPVVPFYGYYGAPGYYDAPGSWYYCPSYGAYYPSVTSCPDAWEPVPAS